MHHCHNFFVILGKNKIGLILKFWSLTTWPRLTHRCDSALWLPQAAPPHRRGVRRLPVSWAALRRGGAVYASWVLRDTGHFSSHCRGFKNTHMLPINSGFDGNSFGELWEAAWASAKSHSKKICLRCQGWGPTIQTPRKSCSKNVHHRCGGKKVKGSERARERAWRSIDSFIFIPVMEIRRRIIPQSKLNQYIKEITLLNTARKSYQS